MILYGAISLPFGYHAEIGSKLTQRRLNVNKFGVVVDSIVVTGLVVISKLPL